MPRIQDLAAILLFACATLCGHAQTVAAPIPLTVAPQPKAEEVIAAFRAAVDTLLQQHKERQQFLFTMEMKETFSTPEGRVYGKESMKFDNLFIAGKPYSRLVERDGKPLSKKEAAEEDRKYNEALANHNSFTPSDHFKHGGIHGVDYSLEDLQSSYTLRYIGWEVIDGRKLWRIEAFPPLPETGVSTSAKSFPGIKVVFWMDEPMKTIVQDDSLLYQADDQLLAGSHDSEAYAQIEGFYCKTRLASHLLLRSGHVIDSEHIFTNYKKFTTTMKILTDTETVAP